MRCSLLSRDPIDKSVTANDEHKLFIAYELNLSHTLLHLQMRR